ncbi:hypothetical protein NPIL_227201 [Nephila pilipes]|uniref:Uncharacterized protein n=1 Tax=Nephila pilipes TaxID=299642 RepID=A0A8X6NDQ9_NEPPI|nr:hypothetical protein NPIL_3391 [Nephila pilipes]GFT07987.1 hypothetical protein NPIL_66011 [Nephila pilipes]GFT29702.1 hypothetical protein NPIL_227201 [Nephila pilipes]
MFNGTLEAIPTINPAGKSTNFLGVMKWCETSCRYDVPHTNKGKLIYTFEKSSLMSRKLGSNRSALNLKSVPGATRKQLLVHRVSHYPWGRNAQ